MAYIADWSRETLEHIVKNNTSIRGCLLALGLPPRCSNKTFSKYIEKFGIDISHFRHTKPIKQNTLMARFMKKLNKTDTCWIWLGTRDVNGYGQISNDNKRLWAHRVSYELFVGPIPDGLIIRHKCDNKPCVNPNHLETGTHADNMDDRKGKPTPPRTKNFRRLKTSELCFWDRVEKSDECWNWIGAIARNGYGIFSFGTSPNRIKITAHRFSYILHNGPIMNDTMIIRHKCDNPVCINPAHLELGTSAENTKDMVERGRNKKANITGEKTGMARFTNEEVCVIRKSFPEKSVSTLAKIYNVTEPTIRNMIRRITYPDVY